MHFVEQYVFFRKKQIFEYIAIETDTCHQAKRFEFVCKQQYIISQSVLCQCTFLLPLIPLKGNDS